MSSRSFKASERGFTLIEMLTVVVIVGVLATLATFAVRRYIFSSKTSEAVSMMATIKTSEEAFKDETFSYLSTAPDFAAASFYPVQNPGAKSGKVAWGGGDATILGKWRTLGAAPAGPVLFSYAVVAWGAGGSIPSDQTGISISQFNLPSPTTQQTYVAVAKSDIDGDGHNFTAVISHSMSTDIHIDNDGE